MPIYVFKHPDTGKEKEVFQNINDEHCYSEAGITWDRVFTPFNVGVDTQIDPNSARQFLDKTAKGGTVGDLWDLSKELSQKRIDKYGKDEIAEKTEKDKESKNQKIRQNYRNNAKKRAETSRVRRESSNGRNS